MHVPARAAAVLAALVTPALVATAQTPPAEIFGRVVDDAGAGIPGVVLKLNGIAADGEQVDQQALSGPDGWWKFGALPVGRYSLTEVQPGGYRDGPDTPGTAGGVAEPPDTIAGVELARGQRAIGYEFVELHPAPTG